MTGWPRSLLRVRFVRFGPVLFFFFFSSAHINSGQRLANGTHRDAGNIEETFSIRQAHAHKIRGHENKT